MWDGFAFRLLLGEGRKDGRQIYRMIEPQKKSTHPLNFCSTPYDTNGFQKFQRTATHIQAHSGAHTRYQVIHKLDVFTKCIFARFPRNANHKWD